MARNPIFFPSGYSSRFPKCAPLFFLFCAMGLAIGCNSLSVPEDPEQTAAPRPNIIYIMADDLGYGDLGCYGQAHFETPHLDKMATDGLIFTRHYAGSTVCAPSRSSLMTGMHTGHTYIRGNKEWKPEGQHPIADSVETVAEYLQKAGYVTGAMGKWGLGGPDTEGVPHLQGFDKFYGYNCQREAHYFYPQHLWNNEQKVMLAANAEGAKEVYSQDLILAESLSFIQENKDTSFFLYLPYTIPHASMELPEEELTPFIGKYSETAHPEGRHYSAQAHPKAAFAAMVTRLDRDIGKVLDMLEDLGLAENTLVLFTSDNGPHQEGGHDPTFFNSAGNLRGIKRDLYEGGIRVPMIAHWKGTILPGRTTDHVSAFWDFLPTACELVGTEVPSGIDGISYLPTLLDSSQKEHEYLYWEFHERGGKQAVLKGNWKGIRLKVNEDPYGPMELYDLSQDPVEEHNIAEEHPEVIAEMAAIMEDAHQPSSIFLFGEEREEDSQNSGEK
ncbi:MAG: arylsulfatase [Bacteroidota bacterium]